MRQEAIEKLVENIIKSLAELIIDVGSPVPDAEWRTAVEWAFQEAKVKAADSILALTQPTLPSLPPKELIAVFRKFRDGSINTENLNLDEQDKWKAELCLETLKAAGYEEKK